MPRERNTRSGSLLGCLLAFIKYARSGSAADGARLRIGRPRTRRACVAGRLGRSELRRHRSFFGAKHRFFFTCYMFFRREAPEKNFARVFSARSAENFWGILSVYRDLQGKIGKIRQAFENNKNPLTTFQISIARNNKNPSPEFPENGRNFSLRGGFIINSPVVSYRSGLEANQLLSKQF